MAVLAVAYGSAAPTLGTAEFAPAARQAPDAPPTTAAAALPAAAAGKGRRATTTTTAPVAATTAPTGGADSAPPTTKVGRARPCYGAPPRQLSDSRSPACIPTIFEGENGGPTSRGVTDTAIRVAVVSGGVDHELGVAALFEFFNRHYEFYGRRIEPVFVANPATPDPAGQRAFADDLAAKNTFAFLAKPLNSRWTPSAFSALARHGVVSVLDGIVAPASDRDLLDPLHPYIWSVYPSLEQQQRNIASFVCSSLAGRAPTHAPELGSERRFGIVAIGNYLPPRIRDLVDGLTDCGAAPAATADVVFTNGGDEALRAALMRLQSARVTTLLCACGDYRAGSVTSNLATIGWVPEILTPMGISSSIEESDMRQRLSPLAQSRLFGLQPYPKVLPPQAQPWFGAVLETNPAIPFSAAYYLVNDYEQLLVLTAGIQAAGPLLTAETFGQGMMSSPFSNSDAGQAPTYMPSVGFGPGDHSFYNDYALVSWSNTAEPFGWNSLPNVLGSWCYLERGARYSVGSYPRDADQRFFSSTEPCR